MRSRFTRPVAVACGIALLLSTPAAADSIYLKNGRVIRADHVRIEGDRVIFFLHGAQQAIPTSLVDRVEADDWLPPDGRSGSSPSGSAEGPDAAPAAPPSLGDLDPAARLDAMSRILGEGGEAGQALGLLQALGGGGGGAGLEALAPMLGALGSGTEGGGGLGGLASLGSDLQQVQILLPALTRLGAALFAPEYSAEATDAAARELLQGLSKLGVSDAEIRAKARQFGIPEDILDKIGRR